MELKMLCNGGNWNPHFLKVGSYKLQVFKKQVSVIKHCMFHKLYIFSGGDPLSHPAKRFRC